MMAAYRSKAEIPRTPCVLCGESMDPLTREVNLGDQTSETALLHIGDLCPNDCPGTRPEEYNEAMAKWMKEQQKSS